MKLDSAELYERIKQLESKLKETTELLEASLTGEAWNELRAENEELKRRNESITFWKDIILNEDGKLNVEQVEKELSDYCFIIEQLPKIYCHITGGLLSKHMYYASTICQEADNYYDRIAKEYHEEECENCELRSKSQEKASSN